MNEADTLDYINGFYKRKRSDWNRTDELTARILNEFGGRNSETLLSFASLFYDSWNFDTGEDDEFTSFVILKWMADNTTKAMMAFISMSRGDKQNKQLDYIRECIREGKQGRVILDW